MRFNEAKEDFIARDLFLSAPSTCSSNRLRQAVLRHNLIFRILHKDLFFDLKRPGSHIEIVENLI